MQKYPNKKRVLNQFFDPNLSKDNGCLVLDQEMPNNTHITAIAFNASGFWILVGLANGVIKVISITLKEVIQVFTDNRSVGITNLECSLDGNCIISSNLNGGVKKWSLVKKLHGSGRLQREEAALMNYLPSKRETGPSFGSFGTKPRSSRDSRDKLTMLQFSNQTDRLICTSNHEVFCYGYMNTIY